MARRIIGSMLALVTMLALATSALAGGWAVVTLDTLPTGVQAEQTISLGFTVRQHGDKPVDVHTWEDGGMPTFFATNTETGETIHFTARKEGNLGHYIVDVTFPSTGSWAMEIVPAPFEGTTLGMLGVLPSGSTRSAQTGLNGWLMQPTTLRIIGGSLVLAALVLAVAQQRVVRRRRLA